MRPAALLALVALAGCSPGGPELYPVAGRVTLRGGGPVAGAAVEFAKSDGTGARGQTDADGRFTLATGGRSGAAAGAYRVAVVSMAVLDGAAAHARPGHAVAALHPKYADFDRSGLTLEVNPGPNDFALELDSAAWRGWHR